MGDTKTLIGKCGFYCGCCPDFRRGECPGCRRAHAPGDCYTFDCVDGRGLEFCPACPDFPCAPLFKQEKATVLDKAWLRWKAAQRGKEGQQQR